MIGAEKAVMPPPDPEAAAGSRAVTQSQLHNFSFPILKKWGNQRVMRCLRVNRKGQNIGAGHRSTPVGSSDVSAPRIPGPDQEAEGGAGDRGFEEFRAKLLIHLRESADRVKLVVPPKPEKLPEPKPEPSSSAAEAVGSCNLKRRKRRGSSVSPIRIEQHVSLPSPSPSPLPAERSSRTRAIRLRSEDGERRERPRFSISLSRDEIAEDVYAVTGALPRRRPRKRAVVIQKQIDSLFPGSWLSEVTVDSYKVPH